MNEALAVILKLNKFILNPIIVLLFSIALVYFIFGVLQYLIKAKSDPSAIKTGAAHMGWGLFGMFVMVSVFAFLQVIMNSLPIDAQTKTNINKVIPLN